MPERAKYMPFYNIIAVAVGLWLLCDGWREFGGWLCVAEAFLYTIEYAGARNGVRR